VVDGVFAAVFGVAAGYQSVTCIATGVMSGDNQTDTGLADYYQTVSVYTFRNISGCLLVAALCLLVLVSLRGPRAPVIPGLDRIRQTLSTELARSRQVVLPRTTLGPPSQSRHQALVRPQEYPDEP
jgi:hypothetical protein